MKKYTALEKYHILAPVLQGELPLGKAATECGVPVRTIRSWKKQFLTQGLPGLERKKRSDKEGHRKMPAELVDLTQALALGKPPLPIATIWRKVALLAQRQNLPPPSYRIVYAIVRKINPALLTLAHLGSKAYQQKYELIFRRECSRPNEIWQVDHTQLDIYLLAGKARERKPWLTIVLDDFSRAICGYFLSFDAPCALHTALALRQAIWRKSHSHWPICGIPQVLYTDHGTDFMSHHIEQVCINLKIRMVNSQVGRPQGRGKIERLFESINEGLLCSLAGYSVNGKPMSKPSLDLPAFTALLENFLLKDYHYCLHSTTGETPVIRWVGEGFLPQLPVSLQELDHLLLSIDTPRKVQRDGIQCHGFRYIAPTLAGFVGESVSIRYDPRDLAEIRVYHQDRFLCQAVCQELAGLEVGLKEIQKARREVKADLHQKIQQAKHLLSAIEGQRISPRSSGKGGQAKDPTPANPLKTYENDG